MTHNSPRRRQANADKRAAYSVCDPSSSTFLFDIEPATFSFFRRTCARMELVCAGQTGQTPGIQDVLDQLVRARWPHLGPISSVPLHADGVLCSVTAGVLRVGLMNDSDLPEQNSATLADLSVRRQRTMDVYWRPCSADIALPVPRRAHPAVTTSGL